MGILASIIQFISTLFGSSIFADALHSLLSDLGAAHSEPALNEAMTRAIALLKDAVPAAEAIGNLVDSFKLTPAHATVVVSAAQAHIARHP